MYYVLWVTSNDEDWAIEQIESNEKAKGLYTELWLPKRLERLRKRGKHIDMIKTLFPGYIFVETDESRIDELAVALRGICSYENNARILGFLRDEVKQPKQLNQPYYHYTTHVPLKESEAEFIRKLTENSKDHNTMGASTGYIRDGKLVIIDGPLKGLDKYVVNVNRHSRKCILKMMLFQKLHKILFYLRLVTANIVKILL